MREELWEIKRKEERGEESLVYLMEFIRGSRG